MKRSLVVSLLAAGVLTAGVAIASSSDVVSFHLGKNLFVAGQDVTVNQKVDGDLYVAGRSVRVDSAVGGDLMFGAMTATINGDVAGSVRGGAQMVNINGTVGKTVLVGANVADLNEGTGAKVNDVMIGGTSVFIGRPVAGDLAVGADNLQLKKPVTGAATLKINSLGADDAAMIAGSVKYYSVTAGDAVQQRLEQLAPERVTHQDVSVSTTDAQQVSATLRLLVLLTGVASVVLVGWLTQAASHEAMGRLITAQRKQYVLTLIMGLVFLPVVALILFVLARLVIFLPAAIALTFALPVLLMIGLAATYQNIGDMVRRGRMDRPAASVLAGGIVVLALSLIPFLSGVLGVVLLLLAMGSLVMYALNMTGLVRADK